MVLIVEFFFLKQKTAYEIASCLVGSEMCIRDRTTGVSCLLAGKRLRRGCVDGGFRGAGKDNSLGCGYTYNEKASKPHGVLCNSRP